MSSIVEDQISSGHMCRGSVCAGGLCVEIGHSDTSSQRMKPTLEPANLGDGNGRVDRIMGLRNDYGDPDIGAY